MMVVEVHNYVTTCWVDYATLGPRWITLLDTLVACENFRPWLEELTFVVAWLPLLSCLELTLLVRLICRFRIYLDFKLC